MSNRNQVRLLLGPGPKRNRTGQVLAYAGVFAFILCTIVAGVSVGLGLHEVAEVGSPSWKTLTGLLFAFLIALILPTNGSGIAWGSPN